MVIVGVPVAGGVVAGAAGLFGRGAHRVVPESSMHAARSIASWLGPDGVPGPDGPPGLPGLPLLLREFVPGSVLGCCCVPEIVRDEPSVEPQRPIICDDVVQAEASSAGALGAASISMSVINAVTALINTLPRLRNPRER